VVARDVAEMLGLGLNLKGGQRGISPFGKFQKLSLEFACSGAFF